MNAIETSGLTKRYKGSRRRPGTLAVDNLSFAVQEGEIFGFLGPNGAGKTTTIYTILGLLHPTSGGGQVLGLPFGEPDALRRVGFLPEYVNLHDYYTPDGMLNYYAKLSNIDHEKARERVSFVLERLSMTELCNKRISRMSRGQIQRLGLAQAFLGDPDLIILDEPTSSLDPVGRKEVKDMLLEMKAQGKTIIISSHILSDIETLCDRVGIMRKGQLVTIGKLDDLLKTGETVRITTEKLPAEAVKEIEALGGVVTGSPTIFEIDLPTPERQYDVMAVLQKSNCPLRSVAAGKASLEDLFFDIMKGEQAK